MTRIQTFLLLLCGAWSLSGMAAVAVTPGGAGEYTRTKQSASLYTPADPKETGGLSGKLTNAPGKILGVFALPQDEWKKVYLATLKPDGRFEFTGLPAAKYDLMVLCEQGIFDGILVMREAKPVEPGSDLWKALTVPLGKSNPFFETKHLVRAAAAGQQARGLLQEVRARPVTLQSAEVRSDIQIRSLKRVLLEDVGAGWSLENTREIFRQEAGRKDVQGLLPDLFFPKLGGLRVSTTVKELGSLELPPLPPPPGANVATPTQPPTAK